MVTGPRQEDSVIDPKLPKAEQEKRVQDEIQKDNDELFGGEEDGKQPKRRPERSA